MKITFLQNEELRMRNADLVEGDVMSFCILDSSFVIQEELT
jgi:hypothetical protein